MSDDLITIEVDGKPFEARKGQMLIEVTDAADAYVPRFCYHKKLSIAANCRMCLVEVERAPKPLPACATPVSDGMKVFTRSPRAISAQRATMEFLLINHPLDCPICDQGGECELQDLSVGYGRDISRYTEKKRVVKDKNIGPLISTDMTRCIHCTRCVRFGEEVQGIQELGTTGRGEQMQIGTYIENSVDHELSGNIIDLCPVGALNNKPYRYSARSWEMIERPLISAHDCVGSNLSAHTLRGTIKRIVPRANEAINETWISDRDRFSYEGIYAADRLQSPRIKTDGEWKEVTWGKALERVAEILKASGGETSMLCSPSATLEEGYLLARIAEHLGTSNIDHRLQRRDVSDQSNDPAFPWLGMAIEFLDTLDGALVVGSRLRKEVPIIAHRLRTAAVNNGAKIASIEASESEYHFPLSVQISGGVVAGLAGTLKAALKISGQSAPANLQSLVDGAASDETHEAAARSLLDGEKTLVLLGNSASAHGAFSELRALAASLADVTGSTLGYLSQGANAAGLSMVGVLPHRAAKGSARETQGMATAAMLTARPETMLLLNVEPAADLAAFADDASKAFAKAASVIALSPYFSASLARDADIVLPIGTYAETAGTFVNVEGVAQSWQGAATPVGEARPAWKVLRVLGNLIEMPDCDYVDADAVSKEALAVVQTMQGDNSYRGANTARVVNGEDAPDAAFDVPIYQVDATVRRARALQLTGDGLAGAHWAAAEEATAVEEVAAT